MGDNIFWSDGNINGETSSTKIGKQVHKERADERRKSGEYDTVNEALRDIDGYIIEVPKRIDKQGRPSKKIPKGYTRCSSRATKREYY